MITRASHQPAPAFSRFPFSKPYSYEIQGKINHQHQQSLKGIPHRPSLGSRILNFIGLTVLGILGLPKNITAIVKGKVPLSWQNLFDFPLP